MTDEATDWTLWLTHRDPKARERLLARYDGLAIKYATRYAAVGRKAGHEWDDLYSAGRLGLIKAVDRFDSARRVKFLTYATQMVRGYVLDAVRDSNGVVNAPKARFQEGRAGFVEIMPLEHQGAQTMDEEGVIDRLLLRRSLDRLSPRRRYVVEQHMLIGRTFREIGEEWGCTSQAVNIMYRRAIARMRMQWPETC